MRLELAISIAAMASLLGAGQTGSEPSFEVASVKRAPPQSGEERVVRREHEDRIEYRNVILQAVVCWAFEVKGFQLTGPAWIGSARYDIEARFPAGATSKSIPAMLRNLLAERFKLRVHREQRQRRVYALVVGKDGPKLKKAAAEAPLSTAKKAPSNPGPKNFTWMRTDGRIGMRASPVSALAGLLTELLDRPVIDMTGLEGDYDIDLEASEVIRRSPQAAPGSDPASEATPVASIVTAIQQLGLRLEPRTIPMDHIVIDAIEKTPTAN